MISISDQTGLYLDTVRDDFPYLTFVHGLEIDHFMDELEETSGLAESVPENRWCDLLSDGLREDRVERFSPADPLRSLRPGGTHNLWKNEYCDLCSRNHCAADSVERDRCARLAFVIGAWDPVETRDIYQLYQRENETLRTVYARIARHENLDRLLDIARPRWPDAFEE